MPFRDARWRRVKAARMEFCAEVNGPNRELTNVTRPVEIIHLSDPHFGADHRFTPQQTPDCAASADDGNLTLAEVLLKRRLGVAAHAPFETRNQARAGKTYLARA